MAPNQLGEFIKNRRIELDLSLREVADKAGISAAQLSRIENGLSKRPAEDTIERIAYALNSDVDNIALLAGVVREEAQSDVMKSLQSYYGEQMTFEELGVINLFNETRANYSLSTLDDSIKDVVSRFSGLSEETDRIELEKEMRAAYDLYFKRREFRNRSRNSD